MAMRLNDFFFFVCLRLERAVRWCISWDISVQELGVLIHVQIRVEGGLDCLDCLDIACFALFALFSMACDALDRIKCI